MTRRLRRLGAVAAAVVLVACSTAVPTATSSSADATSMATVEATPTAPTPPATVGPSPTPTPALVGDVLAAAVDPEALSAHLAALQAIADEAGGTRAHGTEGAVRTADYVSGQLADAGYAVDRDEFPSPIGSGHNVLAEVGSGEEVLLLGAHLDSVAAGPGINDNGSGIAALLTIAEALRDAPGPDPTVRFAFWGAEEGGPFGSTAYVESLPPGELDRIRAYLNFDMIGSPNAVRFVYAEAEAAPGSEALTELFATILEDAGLPWEPIDLEGDSDHGPFADAGIPTGGLFTGGIEPVTEAQAARHGGVAGQAADPCSHRACDTIANVDLAALEEMTRVIARAVARLAARKG